MTLPTNAKGRVTLDPPHHPRVRSLAASVLAFICSVFACSCKPIRCPIREIKPIPRDPVRARFTLLLMPAYASIIFDAVFARLYELTYRTAVLLSFLFSR